MKKIMFMVVFACALMISSCGNKAANTASAVDSDSVVIDSVEVVDSLVGDTIATDSVIPTI